MLSEHEIDKGGRFHRGLIKADLFLAASCCFITKLCNADVTLVIRFVSIVMSLCRMILLIILVFETYFHKIEYTHHSFLPLSIRYLSVHFIIIIC